MPLDRSKYPPNWRDISLRIRAREGQRCRWCRAPNGAMVLRHRTCDVYATHDGSGPGRVFSATTGKYLGSLETRCDDYDGDWGERAIKIVLTVAHLNAPDGPCQCDPRCGIDEHLAALCQRCHLRYDKHRHTENRRRNRMAKLAVRDLFEKGSQ